MDVYREGVVEPVDGVEQVVEGAHHDAGLHAVADHGVSLAGSGGTVREHRGVVAPQHVLDQPARRRRIHLLLYIHHTSSEEGEEEKGSLRIDRQCRWNEGKNVRGEAQDQKRIKEDGIENKEKKEKNKFKRRKSNQIK